MKTESVLTILMYLFKNHVKNHGPQEASEEELIGELQSVGFRPSAIESALNWISKLANNADEITHPQSSFSRRILTEQELHIFNTDCQNYLLFLQEQNILNALGTELVINQVIDLETNNIDVGIIQWVTLMLLYNQDNQQEALAKMELLVLQEQADLLH